MLATPQRFEGSSIEDVLAEVRTELGHDAEIVEANKVRSGGIGGFFAKEAFEVLARPAPTVETPALGITPVVSRSLTAGAEDPTGPLPTVPLLVDIADRLSAAETADRQPAIDSSAPKSALTLPATQPRSRAEHVAQQVIAEHLRTVGSQAGPGSAVSAEAFEPMRSEEMPRISTEGRAFNDVLQRIAADAGPDVSDAVAAAAERPEEMAPTQAASAQPTRVITATPLPAARPVAPAAAPTPASTQAPVGELAVVDAGDPSPVPIAETSDLLTAPAPADAVGSPEVALSRTERLLSWLERDHLPRTTLLSALRGLPQLPELPQTRGVVVAVVGDRARALRLCRQLAKLCGSDPDDVVLASVTYRGSAIPEERRIIDLTDASRDRLGWRRRSTPTFVAVEAPAALSADDHAWTRDMVEALEVHQVIGVIVAARKTEDVAAWTDAIGGVDGIALEGIAETTTPYAVLALEIPVAYLEQQPATPSSWAQVLMERSAA